MVCSLVKYSIGGAVDGLTAGQSVTLLNNYSNPVTVSANGAFTFSSVTPYNDAYSVTVGAQPTSLYCTVTGGAGSDVTSNINSVVVNCKTTAIVTTFAGSGNFGSSNGLGAAASFNNPNGIAVDTAGNAYVADSHSQLIRKISPAGLVSTFAGSGAKGSNNGDSSSASFSSPLGVAVDANGYVYVAEHDSHLIRKISPQGVVTTLAGGGSGGYVNGVGTAARFNHPTGVAVDASGNVFVSDYYNSVIRKITPAGVVTTFAGSGIRGTSDGVGANARFYMPVSVAIDISGNLYVTDQFSHLIRKISPAGVVSTIAGNGGPGRVDGVRRSASFNMPSGIAVDALGNLFVADRENHTIRRITPSGYVSTIAGNGNIGKTDGSGPAARFYHPQGIAVDASGNIYVGDADNNLVRKITGGN